MTDKSTPEKILAELQESDRRRREGFVNEELVRDCQKAYPKVSKKTIRLILDNLA